MGWRNKVDWQLWQTLGLLNFWDYSDFWAYWELFSIGLEKSQIVIVSNAAHYSQVSLRAWWPDRVDASLKTWQQDRRQQNITEFDMTSGRKLHSHSRKGRLMGKKVKVRGMINHLLFNKGANNLLFSYLGEKDTSYQQSTMVVNDRHLNGINTMSCVSSICPFYTIFVIQ